MNKPIHHGGPGNAHKVFPTPGPHGPLPYGHPGRPKPFPPGYSPVIHHGTPGRHFSPRVIVGPVVPGRPLIGFHTDAKINITGPEGLIAAGCVLTALGLILAFAAPHSLPIAAPLIAFGIVLFGLGIFFKTREKPKTPRDEKPKLEGETKGDEVKEQQN